MDDPVTMFDILMVSFFSFVLWYSEKLYSRRKERDPAPKARQRGRKFYWICMEEAGRADLKIWTKQDST